MGMPIQVSPQALLDKKRVKPLSALAGTSDFSHEIKTESKLKTRPNQLDSYEQSQSKQAKAKPVFLAQDIMAQNVVTLKHDMFFAKARAEFKRLRYRHFPIVDGNNRLVGILSDRDMLAVDSLEYLDSITIDKLMKQPVLSASPDTQIREVCQVMLNHHIGALPITDHQTNLLGLITRSDILRSMIKHAPMELWI